MKLINRLASNVHLMFRRPAWTQYAALCYRFSKRDGALEVLLITSRDTGRWVIPKGWPMKNLTAHEAAAQEAQEEAGVKGSVDPKSIGEFYYRKALEGFAIDCKVQVYSLLVKSHLHSFKEKGVRRLEWFSPEEAAGLVNEPGLRKLILDFSNRTTPVPTVQSAGKG